MSNFRIERFHLSQTPTVRILEEHSGAGGSRAQSQLLLLNNKQERRQQAKVLKGLGKDGDPGDCGVGTLGEPPIKYTREGGKAILTQVGLIRTVHRYSMHSCEDISFTFTITHVTIFL